MHIEYHGSECMIAKTHFKDPMSSFLYAFLWEQWFEFLVCQKCTQRNIARSSQLCSVSQEDNYQVTYESIIN
jgi:hypothetical protein